MANKRKKKKVLSKGLKKIFDVGLFLLIALILTFILSEYVVERITIHNHSMEPTLESEDSVLIDKISYRFRNPNRYEIIVFKSNQKGEYLIKRIIGLPYETVQIINGRFIVDGEPIDDIDNLDSPEYEGVASSPVRLSEGEYFVVGDNRKDSIDSRYEEVGIVTSTKIVGKLMIRLLPISNFKIFR